MTPDLLHRIRWANVARAAAIALALLLALAWPRLRAHQDAALPPAVEPVLAAPAATAKTPRVAKAARVDDSAAPRGKTRARRAPATAVPVRPGAKRRVRKHHRHARRHRPRSPRVAVAAATPVPAYVPPAAAAAPAAEFRP